MIKIAVKKVISVLGFNKLADDIRMRYFQICNYRKNRAFLASNPSVVLPPDMIMYETFRLDYERYYTSGLETARWFVDLYQAHTQVKPQSILDWGCGPARVVRHMPSLLHPSSVILGSDFNDSTISWCKKHIEGVDFLVNALDPPIDVDSGQLECIYAISVFTHLSLPRHMSWIAEIERLLSPGGIFIFTTQGDIFRKLLDSKELERYEEGNLVIRDHSMEGRRIFSAFHPPTFIRNLLNGFEILDHQVGKIKNQSPQQDLWVAKKM